MQFSIRFLEGPLEGSRLGNALMYGEIAMGDFVEGFESQIGFWSPMDYTAQWIAGASRAANGSIASCLITSITDPLNEEFLRWWLLYPRKDVVILRESLLLVHELPQKFTTTEPYSWIPEYRRRTEEGQLISEWEVPVRAIRDFLDGAT